MAVTVFVWRMWAKGPDGSPGVGHAAMYVQGKSGSVYVSFWPAAHNPWAALSSPGKIHFVNGDRLWDGPPHWTSKPLEGLNEAAIIRWWSNIQHGPLIDHSRKKPFQLTRDKAEAYQNAEHTQYHLLNSQCSTMVIDGLLAGADETTARKIENWLHTHPAYIHIGSWLAPVPRSSVLRLLKFVTPADVQSLVISVWKDADYSMSLTDKIISAAF